MDIAEIRGAVARGWCDPANSSKAMDIDLAEAISQEMYKLFNRLQEIDANRRRKATDDSQ
jgi:hypothetical protein